MPEVKFLLIIRNIKKNQITINKFARFFAELFAGYRSYLLTTRINLKPMISFHKVKILFISQKNQRFTFYSGKFFGHHQLVRQEFMLRILNSMSFHKFIEERGPPFRPGDVFYDVYAIVYDQLQRQHDPTTSGAVFYSIKSHEDARIALCNELTSYKKHNKPRLNNQQFETIANLLNSALEATSSIDEHGITYMMLALATTFHRKLSEEATQFIYTEIQRHAVWTNMQFWEMSFYSDVQLQTRNLYLSHEDSNQKNFSDTSIVTDSSSTDTVTQQGSTSNENSSHYNGTTVLHEKTALEILAEQMRLYTQKTSEEQRSIEDLEKQTLYALAIHYIQLMVYMKLPLDISFSTINI
ncbi:unnamed protein product [Rotaria magnacalcarata]|uniref:SBF1/SBF2 domain-containing protein n=1 Tax=Rotaria magnacalcarata TaxID=392030 RepID=A0A816UFY8_9BILA|nr:unnamed protein product [Rotaria magnacalcarata]CAF2127335.1 unnamed protein product [Rotaria magnacalcarata]CAF2192065.1 unnamed protein product [Rotaria magnacalcarata]